MTGTNSGSSNISRTSNQLIEAEQHKLASWCRSFYRRHVAKSRLDSSSANSTTQRDNGDGYTAAATSSDSDPQLEVITGDEESFDDDAKGEGGGRDEGHSDDDEGDDEGEPPPPLYELFDVMDETASPFAGQFVDQQGHHYVDVLLEAMTNKLLNEHICPVSSGSTSADRRRWGSIGVPGHSLDPSRSSSSPSSFSSHADKQRRNDIKINNKNEKAEVAVDGASEEQVEHDRHQERDHDKGDHSDACWAVLNSPLLKRVKLKKNVKSNTDTRDKEAIIMDFSGRPAGPEASSSSAANHSHDLVGNDQQLSSRRQQQMPQQQRMHSSSGVAQLPRLSFRLPDRTGFLRLVPELEVAQLCGKSRSTNPSSSSSSKAEASEVATADKSPDTNSTNTMKNSELLAATAFRQQLLDERGDGGEGIRRRLSSSVFYANVTYRYRVVVGCACHLPRYAGLCDQGGEKGMEMVLREERWVLMKVPRVQRSNETARDSAGHHNHQKIVNNTDRDHVQGHGDFAAVFACPTDSDEIGGGGGGGAVLYRADDEVARGESLLPLFLFPLELMEAAADANRTSGGW
jgi:hypothetical protein